MILQKQTQDSINKLIENWDYIKSKYIFKKEDYGSGRDTAVGKLWWDNPKLIFVLITDNEESYEGSQAQIGITKDGKIRWEYQSHCSCNDYEDSNGEGKDLDLTKKDYELNEIPLDWENQIQINIAKLLEIK